MTLVNLGPSVAQNVTITDVHQCGPERIGATPVVTSCNVAGQHQWARADGGTTSLAVGQTLTMVLNATVTASTGNITNTAVGTSTTPDPTPSNTVTVVTPVATQANLTLTKVASSTSGTPAAAPSATR